MCCVFRKKNFPLASSELYSVFKELWCVFCKKVLVRSNEVCFVFPLSTVCHSLLYGRDNLKTYMCIIYSLSL